jgi:hypothetical protein
MLNDHLAMGAAGWPNQVQMPLMQRPHGGYQAKVVAADGFRHPAGNPNRVAAPLP